MATAAGNSPALFQGAIHWSPSLKRWSKPVAPSSVSILELLKTSDNCLLSSYRTTIHVSEDYRNIDT